MKFFIIIFILFNIRAFAEDNNHEHDDHHKKKEVKNESTHNPQPTHHPAVALTAHFQPRRNHPPAVFCSCRPSS